MTSANAAFAQGGYEKVTDRETGSPMYRGDVTFDDLSHFEWLGSGYGSYQPGSEAIAFLKQQLPAFQMLVFLGTWCEDSHILVPQLQKILSAASYPLAQAHLIAVDRAKTSPGGLEQQYHITNVPTIILLRDGVEQGRIVESVQQPLEQELVQLVQKAGR